jgi:CBS domain containing-hemolysin-like protein
VASAPPGRGRGGVEEFLFEVRHIDTGLLVTALPLLAFVALTAGNAFFVAAEFSLVTVDRATVEQRAAGGDAAAAKIRSALRHLSFQLSGAQLGITLTALLSGYLAEPALAWVFRPVLVHLGPPARGLSGVLALALASLLSMLFGELVPKNVAIARPLPTALRTAGAQRGFSQALGWLIHALNGSANRVVRALGVQPQEELASARSPEELGLLAAYSAKAGALPPETALLLRRTLRFGEKRAAEAMTPRVDVVGVETTEPVATVIALVMETGISRFPVYEETLDQVVGVITVIDALKVPPAARATTAVRDLASVPVLVPGSLDLDGVLAMLRADGQDFAVVLDEYGGTDGVVTIEDLVEELVGEIADEHDLVEPALNDVVPRPGGPTEVTVPGAERSWLVDGVLHEDELAELTGFRLPAGPYETLAGFVLARLGHIPREGEIVAESGWEFTVVAVERRRIEQVRVVGPPEAADD